MEPYRIWDIPTVTPRICPQFLLAFRETHEQSQFAPLGTLQQKLKSQRSLPGSCRPVDDVKSVLQETPSTDFVETGDPSVDPLFHEHGEYHGTISGHNA